MGDSKLSPSGLDRIARELAAGEVSRRSALKRLAGAGLGLGAIVAPAGVAEAMGGGCPGGRVKCAGKCCPKNAKCKNGRCKCKAGYTKCGSKCVDTDTSVKHCGGCSSPCAEGETCVNGDCAANQSCGNEVIEGTEVCDGINLDGETCVSLGFTGGTLACAFNCQSFNTSGCCNPDCSGKVCGDDGCGGSCGDCPGSQKCTIQGQCVQPPLGCGDGSIDGIEECDDGDTQAGDGCSPTCTVEPGWDCGNTEPSVCTTFCGDNVVAAGVEVCDGTDLQGATCVSLGYSSGTLACNGTCTGYITTGCVV